MLTLIDQGGNRERPICAECAAAGKAAFHRPENCKRARARRRRERKKSDRWFAQMMGLRDAIAAEHAARRAAQA